MELFWDDVQETEQQQLTDSDIEALMTRSTISLSKQITGAGTTKPSLNHQSPVVYGLAANQDLEQRYATFIVDSGATEHMVGSDVELHDTVSIFAPVRFGNKSTLNTTVMGTLKFEKFKLTNVLKIEGLARNLISEGQLDAKGCVIDTQDGRKTIHGPDGGVCFTAVKMQGLYVYEPTRLEAFLAGSKPTSALELWHMQMGHLNVHDLRLLPTLANGIQMAKTVPMDLRHVHCMYEVKNARESI